MKKYILWAQVSLSLATYFPQETCGEGYLAKYMAPIFLYFMITWYHHSTHFQHDPHNNPKESSLSTLLSQVGSRRLRVGSQFTHSHS